MGVWMYEGELKIDLTFISFDPQRDVRNKKKVEKFLDEEGLSYLDDIEFTIAVFNHNEVIATGSLDDNVLKCFAVREDFKNRGLTNEIVKLLTEKEFENNKTHLFIYTKPENCELFESLGYHTIVKIEGLVALLENKANGLKKYLQKLSEARVEGDNISSIVMNCNPFTKGHLFLIEKAAKENDIVHLFILTEDKSEFSTYDRLAMVKVGVAHLDNVIIHEAGKYIISNATFPSYFIKGQEKSVKAHAYLDLNLFSKYIAKTLNITCRYVGEEPLSNVTNDYNAYMKDILPDYGIDVIEVPRLEHNGQAISASRVREFLLENKLDMIKELVPKTTFDYLLNLNKQNNIFGGI